MSYDVVDFATEVLEQSNTKPVVVVFWADWCQVCKKFMPVLERLAESHKESWALAKVDTDLFPAIADKYEVRSMPDVKLFVNERVVNEFIGLRSDYAIERWLQDSLSSNHATETAEAEQLLAEKNDAAR